MKKCLVALALVAALGVAACGDTETETVTEQAAVKAPAAEGAGPQPTGDGLGPSAAKVPYVVGMDHQLAKDTMQAAGFFTLLEKDCTGQDRMLLQDRNWTVAQQTPAAGTIAAHEADVALCSVKDGE
jgi:hypothetical protein